MSAKIKANFAEDQQGRHWGQSCETKPISPGWARKTIAKAFGLDAATRSCETKPEGGGQWSADDGKSDYAKRSQFRRVSGKGRGPAGLPRSLAGGIMQNKPNSAPRQADRAPAGVDRAKRIQFGGCKCAKRTQFGRSAGALEGQMCETNPISPLRGSDGRRWERAKCAK
jgi:hypothetical protein